MTPKKRGGRGADPRVHFMSEAKRWKGPVVRRDPDAVRQRSVIAFWKCGRCGEFTPEGSREAEQCLVCREPMPEYAREGRVFG